MSASPAQCTSPWTLLRGFVVRGRAEPIGEWSDETERQFRIAWGLAGTMAARYAEEGFVVAIDDVAPPRAVEVYRRSVGERPVRRVLLAPSLDVALERNARQRGKPFDTAALVATIRELQTTLVPDPAGWVVLDSSRLSVTETVDVILEAFR